MTLEKKAALVNGKPDAVINRKLARKGISIVKRSNRLSLSKPTTKGNKK